MSLDRQVVQAAQGPRGHLICSTAPVDQWAWTMDGPPGAPCIMLLHGWMATAALNWYRALPYLGERFRVLAPNLRGHGRQGCTGPPFSLEGCSDDLAAMIEALALARVVVVGYSMGGAVAQVLARRHPDLLDGIVLCATAATFAERTGLRPLVRACGRVTSGAARAWPGGATAFLRWQLARHDRAVAARRASGAAVAPQPDEAWPLQERQLSHLAAFIECGAELNAYDATAWLPNLQVPSAVIVMAKDQVVAPWRQRELARLLPSCRRYTVDAGHDAVLAAPEVFLPVLAGACKELAAARVANRQPPRRSYTRAAEIARAAWRTSSP